MQVNVHTLFSFSLFSFSLLFSLSSPPPPPPPLSLSLSPLSPLSFSEQLQEANVFLGAVGEVMRPAGMYIDM